MEITMSGCVGRRRDPQVGTHKAARGRGREACREQEGLLFFRLPPLLI